MTASNGFPTLNIHELADIWKIGNMALAWAREPLALDPPQLEMFNDLCRRYGLEPSEVLYRWQAIAFPELLQRKLEASRAREATVPDVSGGGVPYSPPQAPDSPLPAEQTQVLPPVLGEPSHVADQENNNNEEMSQ